MAEAGGKAPVMDDSDPFELRQLRGQHHKLIYDAAKVGDRRNVVNPLAHVAMHAAVKGQLEAAPPPGSGRL